MRLFVAIELSPATIAALETVQEKLRPAGRDVRWVRPELMHLTVKFLGEVPDGDVQEVAQAVDRAATKAQPFDLMIERCGCFPTRGPVRVVWAGAEECSTALSETVEAVEAELEGVGFPQEERKFSAHVTLGRVRMDHSHGTLRSSVEACKMSPLAEEVSSMVLMSSELSKAGPTYAVVSRAPFEGK